MKIFIVVRVQYTLNFENFKFRTFIIKHIFFLYLGVNVIILTTKCLKKNSL